MKMTPMQRICKIECYWDIESSHRIRSEAVYGMIMAKYPDVEIFENENQWFH